MKDQIIEKHGNVHKRPGFYQFVDHESSMLLVTKDLKVHYIDKRQNKVTNPNWDSGDGKMARDYRFKLAPVPKDFDFCGHGKVAATFSNKLLLCAPYKSS